MTTQANTFFAELAQGKVAQGKVAQGKVAPKADPTELDAVTAELAAVLSGLTALEKRKAELELELFPVAELARVAKSRKGGKLVATVKVDGLTVTRRAMYRGATQAEWPDVVATTAATMGVTAEVAEAILADRLAWETTIKVDASIADDADAMGALRAHCSQYLTVKMLAKPTKHFHAVATMTDNERTLMLALSPLLRPYKASVRL